MKPLDLLRSRYPEELVGDLSGADCLVVCSFGTEIGPRSVNAMLANYATLFAADRPIVADAMIAPLLPDVAKEVAGLPSTLMGGGVKTWDIEQAAKAYMEEQGLSTALQVAHTVHMGRVCAHALRAGIVDNVVPAKNELPSHFDELSLQPWTRGRTFWAMREAAGLLPLAFRGEI